MQGGEGAGLGELLEGVTGESSGGGEESFNPEEIEVPSTENLKELKECLSKAESTESAAEIQKCASLME